IPANHYLDQNYPNPFNPSTTIRFGLTEDAQVELLLYSVSGELVRTIIDSQFKKAGTYQYVLKANNLPSGTYIYKLNVGNNSLSKKLILLK
ncbi:MAG: T9SS type A sorting domain-containing protein, partial [Ignavibacteriales bacterium]|nr:T9SS type A sorting domain-containing protein [Ignavibacteriales bacterium]